MVQILSKIKVIWLEYLIKKNQTKLDFNTNFLPIRKEHIERLKLDKLHRLELQHKTKLLPFEIQAGIESDFLKDNYNAEVEELNKKFYWEERALKQTLKRADNQDPKAMEELHRKKAEALEELKNQYYKKEHTKEDIESYHSNKEELDNLYAGLRNQVIKKYDEKINRFQQRITKKVEKFESKLNDAKQKYETIEIKSIYDLDDSVLLKLDNLSMHFGGLKAVDKLSFEVKEGEIFGLIGPNGAGKTTVFNCITRFYKPTDGDIYFRNKLNEVVHLNDIVVHNVIKEGISRTFQNVEMIWELNIIENLLIAAHTTYRSGFFGHLFNSRLLRQEEIVIRKKAEKILADLDLLQYAYAYPLGLPYGILKKIELARTLMINPKLIILDEPAAGLNDAETDALAETIKKISKEYNATIFLVEHDMGLVMNICDTVCAISFGQKLAMGTPKEIQNNKVVQEAYLGGE